MVSNFHSHMYTMYLHTTQGRKDKMGRKDSPSNAGTSGEIRFGPQEERNSPVHYDTGNYI